LVATKKGNKKSRSKVKKLKLMMVSKKPNVGVENKNYFLE